MTKKQIIEAQLRQIQLMVQDTQDKCTVSFDHINRMMDELREYIMKTKFAAEDSFTDCVKPTE